MGDRKQPTPVPTNQVRPDPPPAPPRKRADDSCACQHDGRGNLTSECQEHQEIREQRDELLAALKRLAEAEVYVDNGLCSCCKGYWPDEHLEDCEGAQALAAIAKAEDR